MTREQLGAVRDEGLGADDTTVGEVASAIPQAIHGCEGKPLPGFLVHKLRINGRALQCRLGAILIDVAAVVVEPGLGVPSAEDR